jgi:hypothetical protein
MRLYKVRFENSKFDKATIYKDSFSDLASAIKYSGYYTICENVYECIYVMDMDYDGPHSNTSVFKDIRAHCLQYERNKKINELI